MLELTNGQKCEASFDLFDEKGKAFAALPEGTAVEITSSNPQIAQWAPDAERLGVGTITTEHDDIGDCTLNGKMTLADGKEFTGTIEVRVHNSPAAGAAFRVGTPVEDTAAEPPAEEPPAEEPPAPVEPPQ